MNHHQNHEYSNEHVSYKESQDLGHRGGCRTYVDHSVYLWNQKSLWLYDDGQKKEANRSETYFLLLAVCFDGGC